MDRNPAQNPVTPQVRQYSTPAICPTEQDVFAMAHLFGQLSKTAGHTNSAAQRTKLILLEQSPNTQEYADLYEQGYIAFRRAS